MDNRPNFTEYFHNIAVAVSKRGDCTRLQVGAVIVVDNRIWATGYNGTPENCQPGCLIGACPRGRKSYRELAGFRSGNHDYSDCISVHAEMNALDQFKYVALSMRFYSMRSRISNPHIYVSVRPCNECLDVLRNRNFVVHFKD